ncbi:MAG: acetoacetate--CoA ligase [Alphaproteobacteria bacterium]|nr:acetoacetate--CoA ligase [Alphaproteobacteria bacterium]
MAGPLWQPSPERVAAANISQLSRELEGRHGVSLPDYEALHRFSLERKEDFWIAIWDLCGVIAETRGDRVLVDGERMPGARFFPDARLNFAENMLRRRDSGPAMIFRAEDKVERIMNWAELYDSVSRLSQALRAAGIGPGDRVAGFVPNMPETVVAMLAATSLGAVWTSCSPDFGVQGVLDRFGQVEPKVLFTADGYYYNGKAHGSLGRVSEILQNLPSVGQVVVLPLLAGAPDVAAVPKAQTLADFVAPFAAGPIAFERLPFNSPLYILYSSGTTGVPKCIVHGAGGTLLQHLKEHRMHTDVKPGDRVFYFTTCGWMMWNWLVSALAQEATLLLYDGSPFHPDGNVLFDFADAHGMTVFGTSAKYIDALSKAGLKPRETHDLAALRAMTSTGSPLAPESFDYVYADVKQDLQLASISGGTDIVSCFMLGNPAGPVWRGEIQAAGLGMAVDVFDESGRPVTGEKGELVCTQPFPAMPLGFWADDNGERYRSAYFERFANVWHHGDFIARTGHGGFIVYGRSDATLNPGGVRIGTAEIYRQVERIDEVVEAICIGQEWDGDVRVVLFVTLRDGLALDDALRQRIRDQVRSNCTPRHVPARIIQVADIPRTKSGKITELAVRDIVHGRSIMNQEALANPEALELYRDLPELRE